MESIQHNEKNGLPLRGTLHVNYDFTLFPFKQIVLTPKGAFQHIIDSMKDPSIAAFWLITMPQIMGGFEYDDEVKQKIWWQYKVPFFFKSITKSLKSITKL